MSTKQGRINSEVERARRTIPPAILAILNDVRIVDGVRGRKTLALWGPNGGGIIASGMRGIVSYIKERSADITIYVNGGKNRWLSLCTAVSAYLHYAEEGPKLDHLRGNGISSSQKSKRKHAKRASSTDALIRRELQRRIRKMTTRTLLKLVGA